MTDISNNPPSHNNPSGRKSNQNQMIPTDLLNDLSSRFIINVPEEERVDLIRVCFQIELAHWFYLDFYCEEDPKLPKCLLKDFIRIIFGHIPFLQKYSPDVDSVIANWKEYKMAVPTYGAILLDQEIKNVLLVQSFVFKASWGFPKGKVNKDELPHHCAIREVLEETGFDISHLIDKTEYLEHYFNDQLIRLYIITGVQPNVKFHPKTRKEIKSIEWFAVSSLPLGRKDQVSKTNLGPISLFMVIPFVKPLRKWIASKQATLQDHSSDNPSESDKYIMQQNLFAKLSQNELSKYRDIKATSDNNNHFNDFNRISRSGHGKPTYSPPPRMLRQKNLKQAMDAAEKKKSVQPQIELIRKPTYSPPPRMLHLKNFKQDTDSEKKRSMQSQTEERSHGKQFRKSLDFSKEYKYTREKSYMKKEKIYPCSKTWANFSLDKDSLITVFNMAMDLRKQSSIAKG